MILMYLLISSFFLCGQNKMVKIGTKHKNTVFVKYSFQSTFCDLNDGLYILYLSKDTIDLLEWKPAFQLRLFRKQMSGLLQSFFSCFLICACWGIPYTSSFFIWSQMNFIMTHKINKNHIPEIFTYKGRNVFGPHNFFK